MYSYPRAVERLIQELKVKVGSVKTDFESVSVQVKPTDISKDALDEMKKAFDAFSAQFCFKKRL